MKVWVDDRREPPPGWVWVKTPAETIALLDSGEVDELSLDHDLGLWDDDGREQTGYDVLLWIEEQVVLHGYRPPALAVHSANSAARERMERAIKSIGRYAERQPGLW
jgi:hypothetical protein